MQLFGRYTCRTFEEQPFGRLFVFPQLRTPILGAKVFVQAEAEKKVSCAILSDTPEVVFNGHLPKLVLDIDDDARIVADLQAAMPKERNAAGILFIGKDKCHMSAEYGTKYERVVGHIDLATGEFEHHLDLNGRLAISNWRVILAKPTDGIALVKYKSAK